MSFLPNRTTGRHLIASPRRPATIHGEWNLALVNSCAMALPIPVNHHVARRLVAVESFSEMTDPVAREIPMAIDRRVRFLLAGRLAGRFLPANRSARERNSRRSSLRR